MSHFLPFYVQHSKGFISRLVEIARCGHYAVITTHLTVRNLRFKTLIYISFLI